MSSAIEAEGMQSSKIEFVLNLKTANPLGLTVPQPCLPHRRGDRVSVEEFFAVQITCRGGLVLWTAF